MKILPEVLVSITEKKRGASESFHSQIYVIKQNILVNL